MNRNTCDELTLRGKIEKENEDQRKKNKNTLDIIQ